MWTSILFYLGEKLIVDGIFVSFFMWLVLYLYKNIGKPEVIFADFIEKTTTNGITAFRIKYMNIGYKDLIECRRIVKLNMYTHDTPDGKGKKTSAYLETGDTAIVPVIYGAATFKEDYQKVATDIHLGSLNEFKREDTYHPSIVAAAREGTLTLKDVIERYGNYDDASIEVHIMGSDSSGERMHFSHKYMLNQSGIKEGVRFRGTKVKNVVSDKNTSDSEEVKQRYRRYQALLRSPRRLKRKGIRRILQDYLSEIQP